MKTVTFVYTAGVSYKATNVLNIENMGEYLEYSQNVMNASGTITGLNLRAVDKADLLYAVVKDKAEGSITILPGLYDSFDIVPKGASVTRVANIEAEEKRIAETRAANAEARQAKEEAKYQQRRQARKAAWTESNPAAVAAPTKASGAPVPPSAPAAQVQPSTVESALSAAGISESDMAVLRSLNVLR